ncbi:hypothetical protein ACCO45_012225 [Purpureocillium lilacinum]|uniref:Uncharacterized protein n=1 Tax=Purpureocillium lilacinum TaxID=33203 RepID=A0ACC4DFB2_PURLI
MDSQELDEIHAFAVQLGKDAGQMLMQAAWRRVDGGSVNGASSSNEFDEKESSVDIVTKTDHAVEAFIRDSIAAKYPSHKYDTTPFSPRHHRSCDYIHGLHD